MTFRSGGMRRRRSRFELGLDARRVRAPDNTADVSLAVVPSVPIAGATRTARPRVQPGHKLAHRG
jgi:hypothetical protein